MFSSPNGIDIINSYYYYLRFELHSNTYKDKNRIVRYFKNLSYSSVQHHKAQISDIFAYFVNCKKINSNICLNTTIPKTDEIYRPLFK